MKEKKIRKTEIELLEQINAKLEVLILMCSLQGKDKDEKIRILKSYRGPLSKRELERITAIDRHEF
jgi:hypothetical protein